MERLKAIGKWLIKANFGRLILSFIDVFLFGCLYEYAEMDWAVWFVYAGILYWIYFFIHGMVYVVKNLWNDVTEKIKKRDADTN